MESIIRNWHPDDENYNDNHDIHFDASVTTGMILSYHIMNIIITIIITIIIIFIIIMATIIIILMSVLPWEWSLDTESVQCLAFSILLHIQVIVINCSSVTIINSSRIIIINMLLIIGILFRMICSHFGIQLFWTLFASWVFYICVFLWFCFFF